MEIFEISRPFLIEISKMGPLILTWPRSPDPIPRFISFDLQLSLRYLQIVSYNIASTKFFKGSIRLEISVKIQNSHAQDTDNSLEVMQVIKWHNFI